MREYEVKVWDVTHKEFEETGELGETYTTVVVHSDSMMAVTKLFPIHVVTIDNIKS